MWIVIILVLFCIGVACRHLHSNYQLQVALANRNHHVLPAYPMKRMSILILCGVAIVPVSMQIKNQSEPSLEVQNERGTEIVIDFHAYPEYLQDAKMEELFSIELDNENYIGVIELHGIRYEFYFQEGMQMIKTNNHIYKVIK